jgi:DNA primase large subunit
VELSIRYLARYPYLQEAKEWIISRVELPKLVFAQDPENRAARARGRERVLEAIFFDEVRERPLITKDACHAELLSWPFAKALVATVDERALARRYSKAEAKLAETRLKMEGLDLLLYLADQLMDIRPRSDGAEIHFTDYLKYAPRSRDWKLAYQELRKGYVYVPKGKLPSLLSGWVRENSDVEYLPKLEQLEDEARQIRTLSSFSHSVRYHIKGRQVEVMVCPPCMSNLIKWAKGGMVGRNKYKGRGIFSLATFLYALDLPGDEILGVLTGSERYARQAAKVKGYNPPGCAKLHDYGACAANAFCKNKKITHPLKYWKMLSKRKGTKD